MSLRSLFKIFKRRKQSEVLSHSIELKNAEQLMQQGKLEESLQEVEKLEKKKGLKTEDRLACEILKSCIFTHMGNHEEGLRLAEETLEESQKLGKKVHTVDAIIAIADALFRLGKLKEAIDAIEKGETILETTTHLEPAELAEREAYLKNRKGTIYWNRGELNLALQNLQESLTIREQLGNKQDIAASLNNIGLIYLNKGELDRAMESFQKSLKISTELGLNHYIAAILGNIGTIHQVRGEFDSAFNCYENVLKLFQEIGNDVYTSEALYRIITLSFENNSLEEAKNYLQQLQEIDQKGENKIINQRYRLAEAMLLRTSERSINKAEAQKIFQEITKEEIIDHELLVFAMLNLCELLLLELKTFGNEEVLKEVKALAARLSEIAKKQNSYSLLAETYLLESKLALVELDLKRAQQLLTQAQMIAEEKDLHKLAVKISSEHDSLLSQLSKWNDLIERRASMTERLELAQMEDMLVRMIRKKVEDIPEIPEEAVLLVILAESGISMFSKQFHPEKQLNEQLIGGFLSAINAFCRETFSTSGSIERIKHQEYTLLMKPLRSLIFCYIFKGQSYSALQKLEKFIATLQTEKAIYEKLREEVQKGIKSADYKIIEKIAEEIF